LGQYPKITCDCEEASSPACKIMWCVCYLV
jgi:hypothetical protein